MRVVEKNRRELMRIWEESVWAPLYTLWDGRGIVWGPEESDGKGMLTLSMKPGPRQPERVLRRTTWGSCREVNPSLTPPPPSSTLQLSITMPSSNRRYPGQKMSRPGHGPAGARVERIDPTTIGPPFGSCWYLCPSPTPAQVSSACHHVRLQSLAP